MARFIPWRSKTLLFILLSLAASLYLFLGSNLSPRKSVTFDPTNALKSAHQKQHKVLLVSAYFPRRKTKGSKADYATWLPNLLSQITTEVYFFTTPEMESVIREARGSLPITINTTFTSPFEIPPLQGMEERYAGMRWKDREKSRHSVELYAIWNAKPYFLDEASRNTDRQFDFVFWNDASSFKTEHSYHTWPDYGRVEEVWKHGRALAERNEQDLIYIPMWTTPHPSLSFWSEAMGPVDAEFSQPSFYGGHPDAVSWLRQTYYAYHNAFLDDERFVGVDKSILNSLLMVFPSRFITTWLNDPKAPAKLHSNSLIAGESELGACGDPQYYYQFFLASDTNRASMAEIFKRRVAWPWTWAGWTLSPMSWFRTKRACRLTRTRSMLNVLRGVFGEGWRPPPNMLGQ